MEARDLLMRLPPPDPSGEARVWRKFQESRQQETRWRRSWVLLPTVALAAGLLFLLAPERQRSMTLDATTDTIVHRWSDQVELKLAGHGVATGTARDVVVNWETGTVWVDVEPNSGSSLTILTDEAKISVVGTAFSVTRDALGVTTEVDHGAVSVTCADGWSGHVTKESGPHICWPTRPGALLARAEALLTSNAPAEVVLSTLDRGLLAAEAGTPYEGELLARRTQIHASLSHNDLAVADAERYLAAGYESRRAEIGRVVGHLLLADGCEKALRWLEIAGEPQSASAEDRVVLASCLVSSDTDRALTLVRSALSSGESIDPQWSAWARTLLEGGAR